MLDLPIAGIESIFIFVHAVVLITVWVSAEGRL